MATTLPNMKNDGAAINSRLTVLETKTTNLENKTFAAVATSGSYTDLTNTPDLSEYATNTAVTSGLAAKVSASGNRGTLAGYESCASSSASALTLNESSAETQVVTGPVAITVNDGPASRAFTKNVLIINSSATVTLGTRWKWANGKVPEMKPNSLLVCKWASTLGIASLVVTE